MEIKDGQIEAYMLQGNVTPELVHKKIDYSSPRYSLGANSSTKRQKPNLIWTKEFEYLEQRATIQVPDEWFINTGYCQCCGEEKYWGVGVLPKLSTSQHNHLILSYVGWMNCQNQLHQAYDFAVPKVKEIKMFSYNWFTDQNNQVISHPSWSQISHFFEVYYTKIKKNIDKKITFLKKNYDFFASIKNM
jgi:hypothetical protein